MVFKKFRKIFQAYKNIETYEELLNAKEKLKEANKLIQEKEQKINELDKTYQINKERATLACLTPVELLSLQDEKVRASAAYLIEEFNKELEAAANRGKNQFVFTSHNPDQADIKALKFMATKLKNEGFKVNLGDIEYPPGMYMRAPPWEMKMYVKAPEPSLLNTLKDVVLGKPKMI